MPLVSVSAQPSSHATIAKPFTRQARALLDADAGVAAPLVAPIAADNRCDDIVVAVSGHVGTDRAEPSVIVCMRHVCGASPSARLVHIFLRTISGTVRGTHSRLALFVRAAETTSVSSLAAYLARRGDRRACRPPPRWLRPLDPHRLIVYHRRLVHRRLLIGHNIKDHSLGDTSTLLCRRI